jgi:hypothetical protein
MMGSLEAMGVKGKRTTNGEAYLVMKGKREGTATTWTKAARRVGSLDPSTEASWPGIHIVAEENAVVVVDHSSNAPKTKPMSKAELKAFMVRFYSLLLCLAHLLRLVLTHP